MKKIFISADIEGTCGIIHWDETTMNKPDYAPFARQMSREVAAACAGAMAGGADEVLVKDAHDSARNIMAELLPRRTKLCRGWAQGLYCMMEGLTGDYDGAMFTGYHAAAGIDGNPLSHTMSLRIHEVRINGEIASELHINCLIAAMLGVPVRLVTGDRALCEWMGSVNPNVLTVPVNEGFGRGAISIHPEEAVERIRDAAERAMALDGALCQFPMPEGFAIDVCYREHAAARSAGLYPGCKQTGARTVRFETANYEDALRFFHFCL
ncbi:MAG: M55 family metallopeptidase [Christensenellales bacterium]